MQSLSGADREVWEWLSLQQERFKGVVYVAFGTEVSFNKELLGRVGAGLALFGDK